jgi:hypothetical protein
MLVIYLERLCIKTIGNKTIRAVCVNHSCSMCENIRHDWFRSLLSWYITAHHKSIAMQQRLLMYPQQLLWVEIMGALFLKYESSSNRFSGLTCRWIFENTATLHFPQSNVCVDPSSTDFEIKESECEVCIQRFSDKSNWKTHLPLKNWRVKT